MKYINTNKLDDTQYEFLSNLCSEKLGIVEVEFTSGDNLVQEVTIDDLKEDEDGVIYAPTESRHFVDVSPTHFGGFESMSELRGYTPLATILKERKGTLA